MPMYEYICPACDKLTSKIRPIKLRRESFKCGCGGNFKLSISVPRVKVWDSDWRFPNLSTEGDGSMTFESEDAYKQYLSDNDIYETGTPRIDRKQVKEITRFGPGVGRRHHTGRGAW